MASPKSAKKIRRPRKRVPTDWQRGFAFAGGLGAQRAPTPGQIRGNACADFEEGDRRKLHVGDVRLDEYLKRSNFGWILDLHEVLEELDLTALVKAYKPIGRKAIHPRVLFGLIVYGMLVGQWSLRNLEALAVRDVGAWWLAGGLQPDHSTIGKFIVMHAATLTDDLFCEVTRTVVRKLQLKAGSAAIDGTVIEAAASRLRTLKLEAAQLAAAEAKAQSEAQPQDADARARAEEASEVAAVAEARAAKRTLKGKDADGIRVSPSEPDAVAQPLKNGAVRPAYKPSVIANKHRLILGQAVDASSETAVVPQLLEQHRATTGCDPDAVLIDAGYHSGPQLKQLSDAGVDVLCPAGKARSDDEFQKERKGQYAKSRFAYDEAQDRYRCPAGKMLLPAGQERDPEGRECTRYRATACANCPLRAQCTSDAKGRSIKRYLGEEYKEAMAEVFKQPAARERYRGRKAMVEPVYSELRERQRLTRFHRRGARLVALEFGLHCSAYNLKRAIVLSRRLA